nr:FAD/NAD(P)-binding protein [Streptomyces sp. NBC_01001]
MTARRIAVVGSGPRGMMVVERLVSRLAAEPEGEGRATELYLIDAVEVGAGRVYRTDQPDWFLMNTVAGQISAFSGLPDTDRPRAGSGPSFVEWWQSVDPDCPGRDGYAPRAQYGRYLRFVLDAVEAALPAGVSLHRVHGRVDDLDRTGTTYRLTLSDGSRLDADRVVLTTGHSLNSPSGWEEELAGFAAGHPRLRYIRGDSAADMPLSAIAPGTPVGVIGLGLSFFDVMAALTVGRGGRFTDQGNGKLAYRPSGAEPVIVAGSRSGLPLPARGRNQKPPTYSYPPVLFTPERVRRGHPEGPLDFRSQVLPWLRAEMDLVYYGTALRSRYGADVRERFIAKAASAAAGTEVPDVSAIAARFGVGDLPPLDLDALARPFETTEFASPSSYDDTLRDVLERDLGHAVRGNVDSPLKAALDVMRDCRWVLRTLVDFSGLAGASHREDFLGWYVPRASFLAAGPPEVRIRQVLALIDCGLLRLVGPRTEFRTDPAEGRFVLSSPRVAGSQIAVDTLIDARIPNPDVRTDLSPLTGALRERGVWTSYVNGTGATAFDTGGVAVGRSPYHPLGREGAPDRGLYVLGIPTEHTRWFMQVGSSRPGMWSDFVHDADHIAADALGAAAGDREGPRTPAATGSAGGQT